MHQGTPRRTLEGVIPRFVLLIALIAGCSAPPAATPSASPSPTVVVASPTPTPTPTSVPTTVPTATPTPIPLPSFAQLSVPSGTVIWALVAGTRLFRSTDRGETWQERPLLSGPLVNVIPSLIDDHEGWLAMPGSPATQCQIQGIALWHTADAGTTWERAAASGIADGQCKTGLTFTDATHGFLEAYSPNDRPFIYRTADAGKTWSASTPIPNPPGFTSTGGGFTLQPSAPRGFGATLLLEAAGNVGNGQFHRYAFRSSDGGATWAYVSTAPNQEDRIVFVTASRWLQISTPGDSKETTDAGATWHAFATDYQQAAPIAPTIVFGDAQVGYATVRGLIQRTTDGGAHWSTIRTPGTF